MPIDRIIVLLNLRPGRDAAAYEHWARTTDLPIVRQLGSITEFKLYRTTGLLGGGTLPYQYVEILDIADSALFADDVATATMTRVASEFAEWADAVFITTSEIEPLDGAK